MGLKGRPRKIDIPRTPLGRVSRALRDQDHLYSPSAIKRLAVSAARNMADPQWGTVLGRLYLENKITGVQYEAGKRWDALARKYHVAMQAPAPHPKAAAIEIVSKSTDADVGTDAGQQEMEHHQLVAKAFNEAHHSLIAKGILVEKAVRDVCERDAEPVCYTGLQNLKDGLQSLGKFWELARV